MASLGWKRLSNLDKQFTFTYFTQISAFKYWHFFMFSKQIHSERLDIQYAVHKFSLKHFKLRRFYYNYLFQNVIWFALHTHSYFGTSKIKSFKRECDHFKYLITITKTDGRQTIQYCVLCVRVIHVLFQIKVQPTATPIILLLTKEGFYNALKILGQPRKRST
jgi:hypothetical protein